MARSVTFKGNPLTLAGNEVKEGQAAPDFKLHFFEGGLKEITLADLKGAEPAYNAGRLRSLLEGAKDPYRDVVLLNAAAAFIVAGRADTLKLGAELAAREIDSGRARQTLEKLIQVSNS